MVAAVFWSRARHISIESGDKFEGFPQQWQDVFTRMVSVDEKVVAGAAAHRPPVYDVLAPLGMIAEECGCKVLHGVESGYGKRRLPVWRCHAYVECRDHVARRCGVLTADIDPRHECQVVDREACYFFHSAKLAKN